jgi:hypothetical protein
MSVLDSCGIPFVDPQLEALRVGAPLLELTRGQALAHARRLREQHGMSYKQISVVMALYHGDARTTSTWRCALRKAGVAPDPRHRGWAVT